MHKNRVRLIAVSLIVLVLLGAGAARLLLKKETRRGILSRIGLADAPYIIDTRPADGEAGVRPDAFIAADVHLPNRGHGVDPKTLSDLTIQLVREDDGSVVPATFSTEGAYDQIVVQARQALEPAHSYRLEFRAGIADTSGARFAPKTVRFATATNVARSPTSIAFEQVALPGTTSTLESEKDSFLGVAIGPDRKLYAASFTGLIARWSISADGSLGPAEPIHTVFAHNDGPRLITGIAFDPKSTPENPIVWVSHGQCGLAGMDDWSGKISRLSGANLETYEDVVVNLPRAYKDHLNLQPVFGPDGAIYFSQGSNTAMGSGDRKWNMRPERLLTAAVLRLDPTKIRKLPLDVKTEEGGSYDPFAPDAPLTLYATGVRVSFDLLFHSNGQLYAPTNGSASGGVAPAVPAGTLPRRIDEAARGPLQSEPSTGLSDVLQTQSDLLLVLRAGGYFGHPNPTRGEYVMFGGNPTADSDPQQINQYPVGTQPDRNFRAPEYVFGKNMSPNGVIEYHSNAFHAELRGAILVARYSGGRDIVVLKPDASGHIAETISGIPGLTNLEQPLDLVEDRTNGNIYVSEMRGRRITLLRPTTAPAGALVYREKLTPDTRATAE